eukprot:scaffold104590_cov63-Phaeocystis_antarctica.AAC.2
MPIAEGLARHHQRLAVQRISGGEVALGPQQSAEVVDNEECFRVPTAEGLACRLQRLASQWLSGSEIVLGLQQPAAVVAGAPRGQRLSLVVLALGLQLQGERVQGGDCALTSRALDQEPCTQKLEAQRVAVLVHALAAAVGCVLPWARAPPLLEAVLVDPLDGAAAGARLHERAVVFITPA